MNYAQHSTNAIGQVWGCALDLRTKLEGIKGNTGSVVTLKMKSGT